MATVTFERVGNKVIVRKDGDNVYVLPANSTIISRDETTIEIKDNVAVGLKIDIDDIQGIEFTDRDELIEKLIESFFFSLVYDDESAPLITAPFKKKDLEIVQNYEEGTLDITTDAVVDEDYIVFVRQLSHKYKEGADIYPHIHFMIDSAGIPNLLLSYRWYNNGEAPPAWTYIAHEDLALTHEVGKLNILKFPAMAKPDALISSNIDIRVQRDVANDTGLFDGVDSYSGNARCKYVDIHIPYDTDGSSKVYSK